MTTQGPEARKDNEILEAKTWDERENQASGPDVTWQMLGLIVSLRLEVSLDPAKWHRAVVLGMMTELGNAASELETWEPRCGDY